MEFPPHELEAVLYSHLKQNAFFTQLLYVIATS